MKSFAVLVAVCGVAAATFAGPQQQAPQPVNGGLPAVSPDGKSIAFAARRDTARPQGVYIIRADGTGEKQIFSRGGAPVWISGSRILFETRDSAFTVAIDGGAPQPFVLGDGRGFAPSPDGKRFVYSSRRPPTTLMVASTDGSPPRALTDGRAMAFNGAWSPDGKRIAYAQMDSTHNMQMWMMNADGSGARQLSHFSDADGHPQWPSWSSDGKVIAVQAGVYAKPPIVSTAHIWLIDTGTGQATRLAAHDRAYLDETPSFFPDGKRIAFQSDRSGRMEVWVMNADGTNPRQITR